MSREPDLAKRAAWRLRLREFDRGNATVAEFCRRGGVSIATFYLWRRKLAPSAARESRSPARRPAESRGTAAGIHFLPVEITSRPGIEVLFPGGARVTVPCHDHEAIRAVMAALLSASREDLQSEDRAC
jgi:putative transposase